MDALWSIISVIFNLLAEHIRGFVFALLIAWYFHFFLRGWDWLKETKIDMVLDTTAVAVVGYVIYVSSFVRYTLLTLVVVLIFLFALYIFKALKEEQELESV